MRAHLLERLQKGFDSRLTLVMAPAGYGKTTLVGTWLAQQSASVAWISLDTGDNNPIRFLTYLAAALLRVDASVGGTMQKMLRQDVQQPFEVMLAQLIHQLEKIEIPIILVFDDYHLIKNPVVHEMMQFFIQNLPVSDSSISPRQKGCHPLIISRTSPPFPLSRWRLHNELTELRTNDLRFSLEEAKIFFQHFAGLQLSDEQVSTLYQQAEGWVAGLQLAALSMRNQDHEAVENFIHDFDGRNRFVAEYLVDEVISQQSEEIQSFLTVTSLMEHICGSLCDAIREREDSQELIEELERANLFLIPLDDQQGWFRYHQLFTDALANRRLNLGEEQTRLIHHRAAGWFARHNFLDKSVQHYMEAGETQQAVGTFIEVASPLLSQGRVDILRDLLDLFPEEVFSQWAWLSIYRAWKDNFINPGSVEAWLQMAETTLEKKENSVALPEVERYEMLGNIAAIRTLIAARKGDVKAAHTLAADALALLPEETAKVRGLVLYARAISYFQEGKLDEASDTFMLSRVELRKGGNLGGCAAALGQAGDLLVVQGKLRAALGLYKEAISLAAGDTPHGFSSACLSFSGLGEVYYEWNDLQTAFENLKRGLLLGEQMGISEQVSAGVSLANAHIGLHELEQAAAILDESQFYQSIQIRQLHAESRLFASRMRLYTASGNHYEVGRIIHERGLEGDYLPDVFREIEYISLLNYYLYSGNITKAVELAAFLEGSLKAGNRTGRLIKIWVLKAAALKKLGDIRQATETLLSALQAGSSERYVRTFVEGSSQVLELLVGLLQADPPVLKSTALLAYARELIAAFVSHEAVPAQPSRRAAADTDLAQHILDEPLTSQEYKVLRLMASGKNNREIAHSLGVSVNTIKTHTTNIYGKLGVHTRLQAVTRAKLLEILP